MNYIKVCNYCGGVNGYHEQQCNAVGDNAIIRIAELELYNSALTKEVAAMKQITVAQGEELKVANDGVREVRTCSNKIELPPLSPCAVADAANGYFEDALEQREEQLKDEIAAKNALEALQRVHLTALRIVSAALGHPYKNERGKSCIDLANYAAEEIRTLHERSEKAEAERDAALLYGKNRKRDQLKAEMDELRKRYENITVERNDAEVERDRLSAELSELRKQMEAKNV